MRPFVDALWSPAGKGLTSWLSFVTSNCEVVAFPWYPGSGVVLIFPSFLIKGAKLTDMILDKIILFSVTYVVGTH